MLNWIGSTGILGVIGGMGPLASQLFYRKVIEKTEASKDQEHLNLILFSHASMPDRTEAILRGGREEREHLLELLLADGRALEEMGARCIAIPCNTSHFFIEQLQEAFSIPVINMIWETAVRISGEMRAVKRVGILATDGTVRMGLYHKACEEVGLEALTLSDTGQKLVMKFIYEGVKNGQPVDRKEFELVERELCELGCQAAVMACTELSCLKEQFQLSDYYVDPMDVLAERSILACGGRLKKGK